MNNNINKKGFTLIELLAVIVVLAIIMSLAVFSISTVLDKTRKNAFVADAKTFLDGAHNLVSSDEVSNLFGPSSDSYAPTCAGGGTNTKYIPINAINLQQGGVTSPYGNKYKKGSGTNAVDSRPSDSYIQVVATTNTSAVGCSYAFSIFLTDGVYSIGTNASPIAEGSVDTSQVKVGG